MRSNSALELTAATEFTYPTIGSHPHREGENRAEEEKTAHLPADCSDFHDNTATVDNTSNAPPSGVETGVLLIPPAQGAALELGDDLGTEQQDQGGDLEAQQHDDSAGQ